MRTKTILLTVLLFTVGQTIRAQCPTADECVTQGRAFLAVTNLAAANMCFSNAVRLSADHETGNVFYAATRLLTWPNGAAGSNFLNRLGVPSAGRDLYHWTAKVPTDTNGTPQLPAGLSAVEATALLRTNLLAEIIGAEANLAKVTDPGFVLNLTSNETRTAAVTLDYGDIKLLRAILHAAEYFSYTVYSWNLDVQWAAINSLHTNSQYTAERLLTDHPSLLTFATTNDLTAAKVAFQAAVDRYFEASEFIRNRPTSVVRLFNYAPDETAQEQQFRWTLTDLTNSLTQAVPLTLDPHYTVHLGSQFSGADTLRSFLPLIRGNDFILGEYPDLTFGGLVYSVPTGPVDEFFAKFLTPVPYIAAIFSSQGQPFSFQINALNGRGYVVQVSTNLINWSDYSSFVGLGASYDFVEPPAPASPRRFYRVVERPLGQLPAPPNDSFANRIRLSGLGITAVGYTANATTESGEPGGLPATIWYKWTAPASGYVVIGTEGNGSYADVRVYTGSALSSLTQVIWESYPHQYHNGFSFYATAGTTYQIQAGTWPQGGIKLVITFPPDLIVTRPFDGTIYLTSTNITISALSVDLDGSIYGMDCSGDGARLGGSTNDTLNIVWTSVGPGQHSIEVSATDNLGITTTENLTVTVRPPNDNFTNRLPLVGASAVVSGVSSGASKEPGEPNHAGDSGGTSVWWSWVSPFTGAVTISADLVSSYGYSITPLLGVYTGTSVSSLVTVASNMPAYGRRAQVSFNATAGVAYQIAVDGASGEGGNITLSIVPTQPPTVAITSPTNGASFFAAPSASIVIQATANDSDGSISRVDFYADGGYNPIGTTTSSPYSLDWGNVGPGSYMLLAKATDNSGVSTFSAPVSITVTAPPPPNDNFANRMTLTGANATTAGSNAGASRETGEPYHAGYYGGKSVWWTWTAPSSGTFRVSVATSSVYYPTLAVYTGTQLSTLANVASALGSPYTAQVIFPAVSGQTYQIALDDGSGNGGSYTLTISPY